MSLTITRKDQGSKTEYLAKLDGYAGEGILTVSNASAHLIIADHTSVSEDLRGHGVAKALAAHLMQTARASGQKIMPLCPYIKSYMDRHNDETKDLRAG